MTADPSRRDTFSALGVGAVACIACCAGPLIAILGGITIAGLAATVFVGAFAALAAVVAAGVVIVLRRRPQPTCAAEPAASVTMPLPQRRASTPRA